MDYFKQKVCLMYKNLSFAVKNVIRLLEELRLPTKFDPNH